MSISTTVFPLAPRPTPADETCLGDVGALLDLIVPSAEPAVVFSSVAQVCLPRICSSLIAAIREAGEHGYTIGDPAESPPRQRTDAPDSQDAVTVFGGIRVARTSMVIEIRGPASARHCAYEGVLVMTFPQPGPANALLARLVAERAVALIDHERLIELAEIHRAHAEHLTSALSVSRTIGIALGIIMSRHQLTQADAFDALRISSHDTQRKVHEVARELAHTGYFDMSERAHAVPRRSRPAQAAHIATPPLPTPC